MPSLFVGNILPAFSNVELQQWVETHGFRVESAEIIRDPLTGHSHGFGFVLPEESAIRDGQRMGTRILPVNEAFLQPLRVEPGGWGG